MNARLETATARLQPDVIDAMVAWRRDIHAHPELAFAEFRTSDLVAKALEEMGLEVHRGLGGTGVVATLRNGDGPSIGLRADMDALPIQETGCVSHCSVHAGKMHACGHDGHTAILLGAAMQLARDKPFRGTVHFIFQPAEENEGGGRAMVQDGLFDRFPCDAVYGMHNWPGMKVGSFGVNRGPMMAALDTFEIEVRGVGTHAAMPERGVDPFIATAQIVMALQTIPSRAVSALDSAVVSVTQIHGGDAWNVIPATVTIRGTARCFDEAVREKIESRLRQLVESTARAHGASAIVQYHRGYPPTVNSGPEADTAARVAARLAGEGNVAVGIKPSMASEDFAFMLQQRPGAYLWIGADGDEPSAPLHNPGYDFNDAALPIGASFWVELVATELPA
jgi:hippurate hydrolase